MDARARENEITGVRTMYKTDRNLMKKTTGKSLR